MKRSKTLNTLLERGEAVGDLIVRPFQTFVALQAAGGILMLVMTATALLVVNSDLGHLYEEIRHLKISLGIGGHSFARSVHFWVNDGLMAVFFLVVGMEIKRELLVGELSSFRQAILPLVGALGGVVLPAGIYYSLNHGGPSEVGWGIPMATDIAFLLTAATILGDRVPASLTIFLTSLAIVDDLMAVLVIALFYTSTIYLDSLVIALGLLLILVVLNILGVRRTLPYLLVGALVWYFVYRSGVHATVAGVLVAIVIPCRSRLGTRRFLDGVNDAVGRFKIQPRRGYVYELPDENQSVIRTLEKMCRDVEPPLQRLEHLLHPLVIFGILPLFALVNAGVGMDTGSFIEVLSRRESIGIIGGLFLGKQFGIFGASWLAVKIGLGALPSHVSFRQLYGGAILCGIGFTMSIFIAEISFPEPEVLATAKVSVLTGSLISWIVGMIFLALAARSSDSCQ